MKKLFLAFTLLCGFYTHLKAFSLSDVTSFVQECVDSLSDTIDTIYQAASGQESTRVMIARMLGMRIPTVTEYLIERAKTNPLEAIGALTVIYLALWLLYKAYRLLYRILYWLIVKRPARKKITR